MTQTNTTIQFEPISVPHLSGQSAALMGRTLTERTFGNWDEAIAWAESEGWRVGKRRTIADHADTLALTLGSEHNGVAIAHLTWGITSPGKLTERTA